MEGDIFGLLSIVIQSTFPAGRNARDCCNQERVVSGIAKGVLMVVHARAGGGGGWGGGVPEHFFCCHLKNISQTSTEKLVIQLLSKNCDAGCKLFRCIIFE